MEQYGSLPSSAMGVMRLMPSKAKEVAQFSKQIIESVKQGDANPLEVLVMLRSLEAVSELVREEIGSEIVTASEKYAEKKFDAFGAMVERCEVGTKYDYSFSKDPEWESLDSEFKAIEQKRKDRETFLKSLKEPLDMFQPETGEVYQIRPPFKRSKPGVKIYLK